MSEEPFDAGDPASIKARNRDLKIAAQKRANMVKAIMSLPEGRQWIWEILVKCHVFHPSFSTNALTMANNEGERNVGLFIYADLTLPGCMNLYTQMLNEHQETKDA